MTLFRVLDEIGFGLYIGFESWRFKLWRGLRF